MKKLFLLPLLLIVFAACKSDDPEPVLTLSLPEFSVNQEGSSRTISLETNYGWEAQVPAAAASWLTVSPSSGDAGTHTVKITAAANESTEDRTATITFQASTLKKTVVVTQNPKGAIIASTNRYEYDSAGEQIIDVTVQANVSFSVYIPLAYREWISQMDTKGMESTKLRFKIAANTHYEPREGSIDFLGSDVSEKITILQGGVDYLGITPARFDLNGMKRTITVEATSNVKYNVEIPEECRRWISLEPESKATEIRNYTFLIGRNEDGSDRTGTIVFVSEDGGFRESVTVNQRMVMADISVSADDLLFTADDSRGQRITVNSSNPDWTASITDGAEWCRVYRAQNELIVYSSPNYTAQSRQGVLTVVADDNMTEVAIVQNPFDRTSAYADGEVIQLQAASIGKGVDLVIMGDGFVASDQNAGGKYIQSLTTAMEHFFSIDPYDRHRPYFNVYVVGAVSSGSTINGTTKFQSKYGEGTHIECNSTTVLSYVGKISGVAPRADLTVLLVLNDTKYAGTCQFWSDGFSISMCPMSVQAAPNNFQGLIRHECGGHGFAKLADEYIYYPTQTITEEEKTTIQLWQGYGAYGNVSLTSNLTEVSWSGFIGTPKYTMVGAYEGSCFYGKGIWRSEYNSCMNNNVAYFSAVSRWIMVRRIMNIAGVSYTFEQFMQDDPVTAANQSAATRSGVWNPLPPLAPPVAIIYNE